MRGIEDAADRVDETASGSVQKKAKEADLMKKVERCLESAGMGAIYTRTPAFRPFSTPFYSILYLASPPSPPRSP